MEPTSTFQSVQVALRARSFSRTTTSTPASFPRAASARQPPMAWRDRHHEQNEYHGNSPTAWTPSEPTMGRTPAAHITTPRPHEAQVPCTDNNSPNVHFLILLGRFLHQKSARCRLQNLPRAMKKDAVLLLCQNSKCGTNTPDATDRADPPHPPRLHCVPMNKPPAVPRTHQGLDEPSKGPA